LERELPEAVEGKMNTLMDKDEEFLLRYESGSSRDFQKILAPAGYERVTLYHMYDPRRHGHSRLRGEWNDKWTIVSCEKRCYGRNIQSPFGTRIERDFQMVEDADYGIVIWDDRIPERIYMDEVFIFMVTLIAQDKSCEVYHAQEGKWVTIRTMEELEPYAGTPGVVQQTDVEYILKECEVTYAVQLRPDMENAVLVAVLLDTILRSSICLEKKNYLISRLQARRNLRHEVFRSISNSKRKHANWQGVMKEIRAVVAWKSRGRKDSEWTMLRKTSDLISDLLWFQDEVDPAEYIGGWLDESFE